MLVNSMNLGANIKSNPAVFNEPRYFFSMTK